MAAALLQAAAKHRLQGATALADLAACQLSFSLRRNWNRHQSPLFEVS